jgi:hypothetical protein
LQGLFDLDHGCIVSFIWKLLLVISMRGCLLKLYFCTGLEALIF